MEQVTSLFTQIDYFSVLVDITSILIPFTLLLFGWDVFRHICKGSSKGKLKL